MKSPPQSESVTARSFLYIDARGVVPNVETAVKIANYLGVTVEYLVNGDENPAEHTKSPVLAEKMRLTESYERLSAYDKSLPIKDGKMTNDVL